MYHPFLLLLTILFLASPSLAETGTAPDKAVNPQTGMEFVFVKGGCFRMGSNQGSSYEKPAHEVCLSDFYIGKHEVTQKQWRVIMGTNPSRNSRCGDDCPVEQVSWTDASEFIRKLNKIAGTSFRLPTEAEWEYACRSGGKEETFCGGNDLDMVGWYRENSSGGIRPVGGKKPNGLGIYDMSGNVWEWVYDYWGEYPDSKVANPIGAKYSTNSVRRGGSFMYDRDKSHSTWRSNGYTDDHAVDIGFRVALSAPPAQ